MKSQTKSELINRALNLYNSLVTLNSETIESLISNFKYLELLDGEVLLAKGDYSNDFYFVGSGLLVGQSLVNDHEVVNWFCGPNDSCTSISGMYGELPSNEKIFSYGKTSCLALSNEYILSAYEKFPELNKLMRKMFEYYLKSSQQRANIIRLGTAKQRYLFYKQTYINYAAYVPLDLIANFLGMKTSTLSQIIKEEEKNCNKIHIIENKFNELVYLMNEKHYFLKHDLTLSVLAEELCLTAHALSKIINTCSNKNFNEFINYYRIEYVKNKILKKDEWQHLKLEALGMEAGFKSRSSFFSVFKKYVGMSPLCYIQHIIQ